MSTEERSAVDRALDVGGGFDWITPGYALLRGGQVFGVSAYEQTEVQHQLEQAGITSWAWQVMWDGSAYLAYFNVSDADAPEVRSLLGFAEPATSGSAWGWWPWVAVLLLVLVMGFTFGALALVGGAL